MSEQKTVSTSLSRRQFLKSAATFGAGATLLAACGAPPAAPATSGGDAAAPAGGGAVGTNALAGTQGDEMKGKTLELSLAVIAGWPPSQLAIELFPDFAAYAKEKYGYDVTARKTEAGFDALFQKVAPTLASKSQEFNLIVSDSQWLGALSEPGWIIKADDVYSLVPELDIEPYSSLVKNTYQVYPDGSGIRWGFPQMPDTQGIFLRLDMIEDEANQAAFKEKTGKDIPTDAAGFADWTIQDYEPLFAVMNKGDVAGTAIMQSKTYDFFSCAYHPYVYATGGDIWDSASGNVAGVLNTDANAKQLEYFKSLQQYQAAGSENYGIGDMIDLFTTGKVFSAFQWLAVGLFMIPEELKGKVLALPHPKFTMADGKVDVVGAMGGQPWVINSFNDDDHMRVSVDFLKWWYTDETQAKFLKGGGLPWSKKGMENPDFGGDVPIYFEPFKYMLGEGKSRDFWHLPEYAELLAIQQEAYSAYASGQVDNAQNVLNYIASKQQAILFEKGRTTTPVPADIKDATLS